MFGTRSSSLAAAAGDGGDDFHERVCENTNQL
jgi:hypothetical protein